MESARDGAMITHRGGCHCGRVRFEVVAEGSVRVRCVESRIGQVMRNLLANAISFSPKGGTIRIAVRKVAAVAEVSVDDEGPGLPPEKLEAVFDRFYSLRPQGEPFGMHSGLGLSISKQIIEAHRGTLHSLPDTGLR